MQQKCPHNNERVKKVDNDPFVQSPFPSVFGNDVLGVLIGKLVVLVRIFLSWDGVHGVFGICYMRWSI